MRTKGNEYSGIAARHALVALRYSVAFRARVAPCQHSGSSSQMACKHDNSGIKFVLTMVFLAARCKFSQRPLVPCQALLTKGTKVGVCGKDSLSAHTKPRRMTTMTSTAAVRSESKRFGGMPCPPLGAQHQQVLEPLYVRLCPLPRFHASYLAVPQSCCRHQDESCCRHQDEPQCRSSGTKVLQT